MSMFWSFYFRFYTRYDLYLKRLEFLGFEGANLWYHRQRVQKNNDANMFLSTSWRLVKESLRWASISLRIAYLPDSFLFQLHNLGWAFLSVFTSMRPLSLPLPPHVCASLYILSYSFTWKRWMTISNSQYFASMKKLFQLFLTSD